MYSQPVSIKGTKEGLIFVLDASCSFADVLEDLESKLASAPGNEEDEKASVIIHLGNRYVTEEQKEKITQIVETDNRFVIERYESNVLSKEMAQQIIDDREVKPFAKMIRSGQVLEVNGDVLLIGDVNPGGQVRATGNIYIMGKLQGIAHAGIDGNEDAIIVASYMNPNQLRIASVISRRTEQEVENVHMEYGYIEKESNQILIDKLHTLPFKRNEIDKLEGSLTNG